MLRVYHCKISEGQLERARSVIGFTFPRYDIGCADGKLLLRFYGAFVNSRPVDVACEIDLKEYMGNVIEVNITSSFDAYDEVVIRTLLDKSSPEAFVISKSSGDNFPVALIAIPPDMEDVVMLLTRATQNITGVTSTEIERDRPNPGLLCLHSDFSREQYKAHRVKAKLIHRVDLYNSLSYLEAQVDVLTRALLALAPKGFPLTNILAAADKNSVLTVKAEEDILAQLLADKGRFRGRQGRYYAEKAAAGIVDEAVEIPPPTLEELQAALCGAVEQYMDGKVGERGYDRIEKAIGYFNSTNEKFRAEAQACNAWRDRVWEKCNAILADVLAEKRPVPTVAGLLAELPPLVWPSPAS